MKYYYAVGRGRKVGVYETWKECQQQILKIANAKYKKFDSAEKAWEFVKECQAKYSPYKSPKTSQIPQSRPVRTISPSLLNATTLSDPSCSNFPDILVSNGQQSTKHMSTKSEAVLDKLITDAQEKRISARISEDPEVSLQLQNRLKGIEKRQEESIKKFTLDLQDVKTKCDALNETEITLSNISAEIRCVLEKLTQLETEFKVSQFQQKADISQLNADILSLKGDCNVRREKIGKSLESPLSCRKNLSQVFPGVQNKIQKRKFSSSQPSSSSSYSEVDGPSLDTDEVEEVPVPPKKVVKVELSDSEGESQYEFRFDPEGYAIAYTDGACEQNGRKGAKAGIGVWFGDNHPLNCSEPVRGRATNNTAEIQAAIYAIEIAKRVGVKKILVNTDSKFLINCITQWIHKWKKNNWRVTNGDPVKNKEDLIILDKAMEDIDVKWNHVRGHQGIHGNEMADRLARSGAERYGMS